MNWQSISRNYEEQTVLRLGSARLRCQSSGSIFSHVKSNFFIWKVKSFCVIFNLKLGNLWILKMRVVTWTLFHYSLVRHFDFKIGSNRRRVSASSLGIIWENWIICKICKHGSKYLQKQLTLILNKCELTFWLHTAHI